jgi:short-subunit dehydrogenase involved in D-alanine esterification of teichoic acids
MKEQNDVPHAWHEKSSRPSGITRRNFLKAPAVVAATSIALPSVFGNVFMVDAAKADAGRTILTPSYYPLEGFEPEIDLRGKLAVITGASRGIGRATAEALIALGAEVIGTSRDVAHVPNLPAYPLLDLDITKPTSVRRFVAALTRIVHRRQVDILINNAGRLVLGHIIPPATSSLDFYLEQLQLGMETLCLGHIRVTNELMPFMPTQGYARLLFTVSSSLSEKPAPPTADLMIYYGLSHTSLHTYYDIAARHP